MITAVRCCRPMPRAVREQADEAPGPRRDAGPIRQQRGEGNAGGRGVRGDALGILQPHAGDRSSHGDQLIADQARFHVAFEHEQHLLAVRGLRPGRAEARDLRRDCERQIHGEGGAGPGHACHADAAAHLIDEALGDGETEAGAAVPSRRSALGLLELGEDALDRIGRHAGPGVAHGKAEHDLGLAHRAPRPARAAA